MNRVKGKSLIPPGMPAAEGSEWQAQVTGLALPPELALSLGSCLGQASARVFCAETASEGRPQVLMAIACHDDAPFQCSTKADVNIM